ncbi:hypothetical protein [Streptomyces mashuensis]|nr:hypothetical protein [Streptomyces mashuensis]
MTVHDPAAPSEERLRFDLPEKQRSLVLLPGVVFGVLSAAAVALPGPMNGKRMETAWGCGAIALTAVVVYLLFSRDFTELDARGISMRRFGFAKRFVPWQDVAEIAVRETVGQGKRSRALIVFRHTGRKLMLTAPYDGGSGAMASDSFPYDAERVVAFWQRRTGRPRLAARKIVHQYKLWGVYKESSR